MDSFLYRIENKIEVDHHDMGFLYSLSCVSAYKLTGSEKAKKAALLAADQLCSRFQEKGGFIQAWGALGAADNYRYIIDCLLNVPLLYWATDVSGDSHYADLAHKHVATCLANSIRPDGKIIDGKSFVPLIDGTSDSSAHRPLYWNFPNHWGVEGPGINFNTAIRLDNYKLIYNYATGEKELYDVGSDITESHNLAAERPDLVKDLSHRLGTYLRSVDAQRPSLRRTGKPLPWPDEK